MGFVFLATKGLCCVTDTSEAVENPVPCFRADCMRWP